MKKLLWLTGLIFFFGSVTASAQDEELLVHGVSPNLYLVHAVTPRENWYSVGRLFNANPKELPGYNGRTLDHGLDIGETLKIPLSEANFSQDGSRMNDEVLVPLYYIVGEREWLYRVSVNHNKVPIEYLEKWNHITNDQVRPGMKLIVGFLKVHPGQSALASRAVNPGQTPPPPAVAENNAPPPAVDKKEPAAPPAVSHPEETANPGPAEKDDAKTTPSSTETAPPAAGETRTADHKGGYFRHQFDNSGKSNAGNAAVFKSTSGWDDGKYYALMNDLPVGTIVRVTFPSTHKSVYVKVLGPLPEMKESAGLLIRLSDAAASELGAGDNGFYVNVNY